MKIRTLVFSLLTIFFVALVSYGVYAWWQGGGPASAEESFSEEYELAFQDYDGDEIYLSSFRSKPLVVFTYASWCPFCGEELERLSRIQLEYDGRVAVVAINRAESRAEAKAFTDQLSSVQDILFLLDPEDAYFKSINGYAMPETVFIESYGRIFAQHRGPLSDEQLRAYVSQLLIQ